jgi:hypothetical protein
MLAHARTRPHTRGRLSMPASSRHCRAMRDIRVAHSARSAQVNNMTVGDDMEAALQPPMKAGGARHRIPYHIARDTMLMRSDAVQDDAAHMVFRATWDAEPFGIHLVVRTMPQEIRMLPCIHVAWYEISAGIEYDDTSVDTQSCPHRRTHSRSYSPPRKHSQAHTHNACMCLLGGHKAWQIAVCPSPGCRHTRPRC